jgi:hypothetical protein
MSSLPDHGERAPLAEVPTENKENEEPATTATTAAPNATTATTTATTTTATVEAREAQMGQVRHQDMEQQLQQVTYVLEGVLRNQTFFEDHAGYQLRQTLSRTSVSRRSPIQHRRTKRHDLAGASVWTGDILSRIWGDRLLGAAAGAILTTAGLWCALITGATISYALGNKRGSPVLRARALAATLAVNLRAHSEVRTSPHPRHRVAQPSSICFLCSASCRLYLRVRFLSPTCESLSYASFIYSLPSYVTRIVYLTYRSSICLLCSSSCCASLSISYL